MDDINDLKKFVDKIRETVNEENVLKEQIDFIKNFRKDEIQLTSQKTGIDKKELVLLVKHLVDAEKTKKLEEELETVQTLLDSIKS